MEKADDRILFLDIDGPMIPLPMYLKGIKASRHRYLSEVSVLLVKKFCDFTGAKIVTNSQHNYYDNPATKGDLREDLIAAGIDASTFHQDWRTAYGLPFGRGHDSRLLAISDWVEAHPELKNWVCFDDVHFTDSHRLICIDFNEGVQVRHVNRAASVLAGKEVDLFRNLLLQL